MSTDVVVAPSKWIPDTIIFIIFVILNSIILRKEYNKRKQSTLTFTTKWFKYTSIGCMVCAVLHPLSSLFRLIPGLCLFSIWIHYVFAGLVAIFMTSYQLIRLYYCFSNDQIHSKKGYPKWMFIVLFIIACTCTLLWGVIMAFNASIKPFRYHCKIDNKWYLQYQTIHIPQIGSILILILFVMLMIILLDAITLFMYHYKIRLFKDFGDKKVIHKRIKNILNKIFILTLFYQITTCIAIFLFFNFGVDL